MSPFPLSFGFCKTIRKKNSHSTICFEKKIQTVNIKLNIDIIEKLFEKFA